MTPHACAYPENDTLRVDVERENKLQVRLHHLDSVVDILEHRHQVEVPAPESLPASVADALRRAGRGAIGWC